MGTAYCLANQTRREVIMFANLPASSKREIAGCSASASVTAWYLLEHMSDTISFVADSEGFWPFATGGPDDLALYEEVTDKAVEALIAAGILEDEGRESNLDDEVPELYCRKLRNIWGIA